MAAAKKPAAPVAKPATEEKPVAAEKAVWAESVDTSDVYLGNFTSDEVAAERGYHGDEKTK